VRLSIIKGSFGSLFCRGEDVAKKSRAIAAPSVDPHRSPTSSMLAGDVAGPALLARVTFVDYLP